MSSPRPRRRSNNGILFLALAIAVIAALLSEDPKQPPPESSNTAVSTPVTNPIADLLQPVGTVQAREGTVATILIDTSGSMEDRVRDVDGTRRPKIDIARRSALELVNQFDRYAREHSDQTIFLGIYEFSDRGGQCCREVIKLGPAGASDPATVQSAISRMRPKGGTPIGDAMIQAKREMDATGLSRRHLLVITDGENNQGYSPADVARVVTSQTDKDRASIYFVAFDIAAEKFNSVRDAGGLILAASNETELKGTLDYLLTGKILAEQPAGR
jgi:Ca-activated chloride channel homolog